MKGKMNLYYDEEGDYLEIFVANKSKNQILKNLGKGVFEKRDEKTGEIIGIAILGFKKRTKKLKSIKVDLPFEIKMV